MFLLGNDASCYDEIFRGLNRTAILQGDVAPDKGIITTLDHSAQRKQRIWRANEVFTIFSCPVYLGKPPIPVSD